MFIIIDFIMLLSCVSPIRYKLSLLDKSEVYMTVFSDYIYAHSEIFKVRGRPTLYFT